MSMIQMMIQTNHGMETSKMLSGCGCDICWQAVQGQSAYELDSCAG